MRLVMADLMVVVRSSAAHRNVDDDENPEVRGAVEEAGEGRKPSKSSPMRDRPEKGTAKPLSIRRAPAQLFCTRMMGTKRRCWWCARRARG